jgi:hypothetical protein
MDLREREREHQKMVKGRPGGERKMNEIRDEREV